MRHELKMRDQYFKAAWAGRKPFEIRHREPNEPPFEQDDEIVLKEIDGSDYTGRTIEGVIEYVTDFEQKRGYVVFSYRETCRTED